MEKPKYSISPEAIANGINDLLDEKEELQERIDKAIEYIEKVIKQNKAIYGEQLEINEFNYLLDILKGE